MRLTRLFSASNLPAPARSDATLVAELHAFAIRHVPARFYQALQLALPAAVSLSSLGWHRSAALMIAVSAFGVWALGEQRLEQAGDADMGDPPPGAWFHVVHRSAAVVAGLTIGILALELFIRLMTKIAACPGCAG